MNRNGTALVVGVLLVMAGFLFLLQNFGLLFFSHLPFWAGLSATLWGMLFAAGGLAFLGVFASNRDQWWAAIPGFTLMGLGGLIWLGGIAPRLAAGWGAPTFFVAIALGFVIIYLTHPENWWAIIPGGTMLTLSAVTWLGARDAGTAAGGILFLGLGLTFLAVYLLPKGQTQRQWALIPGGIMLFMGLLVSASASHWINLIWPLALILGGAFLVLRNLSSHHTVE